MKKDLPATNPLPGRIQFAYALGQLGWATLVNIIGFQLVYFYIPPDGAGLPTFITQVVFLVVLNAVTLIAASGRLLDAITDPLIASWSDRSTHKRGRRIPYMMWGGLPAAVFCVLMFTPPVSGQSGWNIVWLLVMQALFYVALTTYVTPYFALLPELGKTPTERLNLSTWISITYALGIIAGSQVPTIAGVFEGGGFTLVGAWQMAFVVLAVFAAVMMYIPVVFIDEKKYAQGSPSSEPLLPALRKTWQNMNFRYYVVADFTYFTGITIIQTGLLFFITVLLGFDEERAGVLLLMTFAASFVFYPIVNLLARRYTKQILVVFSFMGMSLIFIFIFFFGRLPLSNDLQANIFAIAYAIPVAFLGILPNAILADIAGHDALKSGQPKEGMFFAARTLMQKFGQTFGIFIFAMLTTLGKDPGDDLGIRLSGLVGFALCLIAGIVFMRYNETELLDEVEAMQKAQSA